MSSRDDIIARLMKMKALADRGVGGERAAAEKLLAEVAEKYGIDLNDLGHEAEEDHPLSLGSGWRLSLFCQLAAMMRLEQYGDAHAKHCLVLVNCRYAWSKGRAARRIVKRDRFFRGTKLQWVELNAKFDILSRDYEEQRAAFYEAFLRSNDLLLPYGTLRSEFSDEEIKRAELAERLSVGITPSNVRKMIEG